ncbi:MAG: ATP-binding protein [Sideroxydans sp.]|nr:ATP-binding protein [Sideroxydans sp.]
MKNALLSPAHGHTPLSRLVLLRHIAIIAQLFTLAGVWHFLNMQLDWQPMLLTIAALTLFNLLSSLRLHSAYPVAQLELFGQLCVDVLALSVLLYYGGGSTNPFISLFLLPLVIAAATLSARYTWGMAALTLACYSALMIYFVPLPHSHHDHNSDSAFSTHVVGMWLGFFISAMVVAYFVTQMAAAVRKRDEQLAHAREDSLRNERIVALATQAAAAAHEMSTPLSTMAVVINELQHEIGDAKNLLQSEWQENLAILNEQVHGCKRILDKILSNAASVATPSVQATEPLLAAVLDEWQLLRPSAKYHYLAGSGDAHINVDNSLRAALLNLLNNAADASPDGIQIRSASSATQFIFSIVDNGAGLSAEALQNAGAAFFTTKQEGRGLGLLLANATVERLGGKVRLYNHSEGGAITELSLPRVQESP